MTPSKFEQLIKGASKSCQRLNPLGPPEDQTKPNPLYVGIEIAKCVTAGWRPSTDEADLNKTESAYLAWLRTQDSLWIGIQSITLKMGHDLRYTPDFWRLTSAGLAAIDTKATNKATSLPIVKDDSIVKIRMASRCFPMFSFQVAWKVNGVWQHKELKP